MSNDKFKGVDLSLAKLPDIEAFNERMRKDLEANFEAFEEEFAQEREEKERIETEYREAVVGALQGIEKNTAILTEMTVLMKENAGKQDQIIELMTEILSIMKASNKEEATSRFNAVMKKIVAVSDGVNSVQSLYTMANTVYTASQSMF